MVGELVNHWGSVMSYYCEKLVAEAGDSSGTQRKWNAHHWKPLPSNALKTVRLTRACACAHTLFLSLKPMAIWLNVSYYKS
jgi:hypothetical protein